MADQIDQCLALCDAMIQELEAQRPKSRKGRYDRQSPRQIDFAIRTVRRLAERFKAFRAVGTDEPAPAGNGDRLAKAIALARELRPIVAATRHSTWRAQMLQRLDELIPPRGR